MCVSNASGSVVDATRLLLLNNGIGLLTAGGGILGGVGCRGAGHTEVYNLSINIP